MNNSSFRGFPPVQFRSKPIKPNFVSIKTVNHGAPLKTGPGVVFKDTKPAFYYIEWIVFACHPERFGYGISLAVVISDFFFNLITLLIGLEVLANNAL